MTTYLRNTVTSAALAALVGASVFLAFAPFAFAVGSNGSFETGDPIGNGGLYNTNLGPASTDIADWTIVSGNIDYIGTYWTASDGARSIDLNGLTTGVISQTFPTVVGATYDVSFDISGDEAGPADVKELSVSATGAAPQNFTYDMSVELPTHANMKWATHTYSFVASSVNTTLTFASQIGGAYGPALDDVSIVETIPSVCDQGGSSGGIVIHVCNGGSIDNSTSASADTGGNTAGGSYGGNGGRGGSVVFTGNFNNGGARAGGGGDGGNASAGGFVQTGDATANANTVNDANSTDLDLTIPRILNSSLVSVGVDNGGDCNCNRIDNNTRARARTGENTAGGSVAGNGDDGGEVETDDDGDNNNGGASAGAGGAGGDSPIGGTVKTGHANSTATTRNFLNGTYIRVR